MEIEISLFSRQCSGRRRISDRASFQSQARAWNQRTNLAATKINGQFKRKDARRKFRYSTNQFKRS